MLFATVHGETLLVGDTGLFVRLVCDHGYVQVAMILDDVPDAAAVEAVDLHHSGQTLKVVLVGNDPPGIQRDAGFGGFDVPGGTAKLPTILVQDFCPLEKPAQM